MFSCEIFIIKNYPVDIKPLWNIKIEDKVVKNVNVILHGKKSISSAEHSCDRQTIADGTGHRIKFTYAHRACWAVYAYGNTAGISHVPDEFCEKSK